MQSFFKAIEGLFTQMSSGDTLHAKSRRYLATFGLGWFLGRYLRNRLIPPGRAAATSYSRAARRGAIEISPFIIATLLLFLTRGLLNTFGLEINFLDLMLQLMGALVLIRIARVPAASSHWGPTPGSRAGRRA